MAESRKDISRKDISLDNWHHLSLHLGEEVTVGLFHLSLRLGRVVTIEELTMESLSEACYRKRGCTEVYQDLVNSYKNVLEANVKIQLTRLNDLLDSSFTENDIFGKELDDKVAYANGSEDFLDQLFPAYLELAINYEKLIKVRGIE